MKGDGKILAGVAISLAAIAGVLIIFAKPSSPRPPSSSPLGPTPLPSPVVFFPDLKVGDSVLVDAAAANIPGAPSPLVVALVDLVMTDRSLISIVAVQPPFRGTIPRAAIRSKNVAVGSDLFAELGRLVPLPPVA